MTMNNKGIAGPSMMAGSRLSRNPGLDFCRTPAARCTTMMNNKVKGTVIGGGNRRRCTRAVKISHP